MPRSRLLPIMWRSFAGALLILILGAPGCQPQHYQWMGPTAAFKRIDANKDGELSRAEWQARNWQTNLYTFEVSIWDSSDCDRNGRLTWPEYYRGVLDHKQCSKPRIYPAIPLEERSSPSFYPMPLTDPELQALRVFGLTRPDEVIAVITADFPSDFYESEIDSNAELHCIDDNSRMQIQGGGPYYLQHRTAACSVANLSTRNAVTLLVLRITVEFPDHSETTWHAKPVYLQPESSTNLTVILPATGLSSAITLQQVRGMRGTPAQPGV